METVTTAATETEVVTVTATAAEVDRKKNTACGSTVGVERVKWADADIELCLRVISNVFRELARESLSDLPKSRRSEWKRLQSALRGSQPVTVADLKSAAPCEIRNEAFCLLLARDWTMLQAGLAADKPECYLTTALSKVLIGRLRALYDLPSIRTKDKTSKPKILLCKNPDRMEVIPDHRIELQLKMGESAVELDWVVTQIRVAVKDQYQQYYFEGKLLAEPETDEEIRDKPLEAEKSLRKFRRRMTRTEFKEAEEEIRKMLRALYPDEVAGIERRKQPRKPRSKTELPPKQDSPVP